AGTASEALRVTFAPVAIQTTQEGGPSMGIFSEAPKADPDASVKPSAEASWWEAEVRDAPRKQWQLVEDEARTRSAALGATLADTSEWDARAARMGLPAGDGRTGAPLAGPEGRWRRTQEGTPRVEIDDDGEECAPSFKKSTKGFASSKWQPATDG